MAQMITLEGIMESVERLEVKDEVRLLQMISKNLFERINASPTDTGDLNPNDLAKIAMTSGSFDFLNDEENLYSEKDLKVKYR